MAMRFCRSPHGERGLKYARFEQPDTVIASLSSWRAWIEMWTSQPAAPWCLSRSPHGERGLKYQRGDQHRRELRRSPHGERGLKCRV